MTELRRHVTNSQMDLNGTNSIQILVAPLISVFTDRSLDEVKDTAEMQYNRTDESNKSSLPCLSLNHCMLYHKKIELVSRFLQAHESSSQLWPPFLSVRKE